MVDFRKLLLSKIAQKTPGELSAYHQRVADERALEEAIRPIASRWIFTAPNDLADLSKGSRVIRDVVRDIGVRVEPVGTYGRSNEVLQFVGGPTGHEGYSLDIDFCEHVLRDAGSDWSICAGGGRWPACSVATSDIIAVLDMERPDLMSEARDKLTKVTAPTMTA